MNHLDLFSGIGGFSLAAEKLGIKTVGFVEKDPFCRAVLGKHFPGVPAFDDIKALKVDTIATLLNDYEALTAEDQKMAAPRKDFSGAVAMYVDGMFSIQEVANYYGMSRQAMWKILRRRGVEFRSGIREGDDNHFHRGTSADAAAHDVMEKAVLKGVLVPAPCEVCGEFPYGTDGRRLIQGHHDDYNFPLKVRWLCQRHHHEWHKHNKAVPRGGTAESAVAGSIDLYTGGFP